MRSHKDIEIILAFDMRIVDEEFDDVSEQETHHESHFDLAHAEDDDDITIH